MLCVVSHEVPRFIRMLLFTPVPLLFVVYHSPWHLKHQGGLRLSEDRWRTEVEQLQAAIKQAKLDLTASQGKHMEALEQLARLEAEHGFVKAGCQGVRPEYLRNRTTG